MCDREKIHLRLHRALERLYDHDLQLIHLEVHERTTAARLAIYLQEEFPLWNVDCEYNRDGVNAKRIQEERIFPDVIVHRRDTQENLLAIEMKGHWSNRDRDDDYHKLTYLTGPEYGYSVGAHIELEEDAYRVVWFEDGEALGEVQ